MLKLLICSLVLLSCSSKHSYTEIKKPPLSPPNDGILHQCLSALRGCPVKEVNCARNQPMVCATESESEKFKFFCYRGHLVCQHTKTNNYLILPKEKPDEIRQ